MSAIPLPVELPSAEIHRRLGWWLPPGPAAEPAVRPLPESAPRIALIAGDRLWRGLRHEARVVLLTPRNWKLMLAHGSVDLLLIESCRETATGHWYLAQSGAAPESALLAELLAFAGRVGVPRVYWHTVDHAWHDHYAGFARGFDLVFCADEREAETLRGAGIRAESLGPAVQPAVFNPVRPAGQILDAIPLLCDGIVDRLRPRGDAAIFAKLGTRGLRFIDSHARIFASRLEEEFRGEDACLGCVTHAGRLAALRHARVVLTLGDSHLTPTEQRWQCFEAAACRVPIAHFGALASGDPRAGVVTTAPDEAALLSTIDAWQADDLRRERAAHLAWRNAVSGHGFGARVDAICRALGLSRRAPEMPAVSVVMPTFRRERLADCVRTFDAQDYADKELLIVFNGELEVAEREALTRGRADIRVLTVPRERHTGACMNAGIAAAKGEYCFKMDDDDTYGAQYLADLVRHALATGADVFGKPPRWYAFGGDSRVHRRVRPVLPELREISPDELASGAVWMGGNSLSGRRRALLDVPFPDTVFSAADTAFLMSTGQSALKVVMFDALNLVTQRNPDEAGHTWRARASSLSAKLEPTSGSIADVCV